ncbi:MAG TPA: hypothetical protein VMF52_00305 [Steroidobacteraceae bacterium]|nr:hypothetical protein [Steroidobacteraceae bacterium]
MRQMLFVLSLCGIAQAQVPEPAAPPDVKAKTITLAEVKRCFGKDPAFVQRFAAYEDARVAAQREIDELNRTNTALEEQKQLVEADRLAVDKLKAAYEPLDQDMDARQKKLDALRAKDAMTEQDVNTYNRLIREFNRAAETANRDLEGLKAAQAAFNQRVDAFNAAVDARDRSVADFKTRNAAFFTESDALAAELDARRGHCEASHDTKGEAK